MSGDRTKTLSVHRDRDVARECERDLQALLDSGEVDDRQWWSSKWKLWVPAWARGVRCERVGFFGRPPGGRRKLGVQHVVVATEKRGH